MIVDGARDEAKQFFATFSQQFEALHSEELKTFDAISLRQHATENPTAVIYRENRYRIPLNSQAYNSTIAHLETNSDKGGGVILGLLQNHCIISATSRGALDQYSFEQIVNQGRNQTTDDNFAEGISGAFVGASSSQDTSVNSKHVDLGLLPMDAELTSDVRAELEEADTKNPPEDGQLSLLDTFEQKIKREESVNPEMALALPRPPPRARDVFMEVQKVREYRDRYKIDGRTGGVGPAVSVCMFTFHNTLDQ